MSTHPKIIKHKVGLLHLAEELGNVSQACKVMGYSRDTFYRYRQAVGRRRLRSLGRAVAPEAESAEPGGGRN